MASPGNGQPPQVIARTDSVTSLPTAEFLAREALASQYGTSARRTSWTSRQATASQQQAPAANTQMTAPLVVTADQDQTSPIILPVVPATPLVGSSPAGSSGWLIPEWLFPEWVTPGEQPHQNLAPDRRR